MKYGFRRRTVAASAFAFAAPAVAQSDGGGRQRAHVTLAETAQMASETGVKTIILTHFTPGAIDEEATIAELRKLYSGRVLFAVDGMAVDTAQ